MNIKIAGLRKIVEEDIKTFKEEWESQKKWLQQVIDDFISSDCKENFQIAPNPSKIPYYHVIDEQRQSSVSVMGFEDKLSVEPEASAGSPLLRKSIVPFNHTQNSTFIKETPLTCLQLNSQLSTLRKTTPMPKATPMCTPRNVKTPLLRTNSVKKLIEKFEDQSLGKTPEAEGTFRMNLRSKSKMNDLTASAKRTSPEKRQSGKRIREETPDCALPSSKKIHFQEPQLQGLEKTTRKNPMRMARKYNTRISSTAAQAESKNLKWLDKKKPSIAKGNNPPSSKASMKLMKTVMRNDSLLASSKIAPKLRNGLDCSTLGPAKGLTTPHKSILRGGAPSSAVKASPRVESIRTLHLKEELDRKDLKHEEVLRAQEEARKMKLEEAKRRREEKRKKVKEQKELQEREKEEKLRLKEEQKEQQKEMERIKQQEKLKLQAQIKKKKEAEFQERKKQEEQARLAKQAEMAKLELQKHQEVEKQRLKEIKAKAIAQGFLTPGKKALCNGTPKSAQTKTPAPQDKTYCKEAESKDSYLLTPLQPPKVSKDPDDYGLEDLQSDCETDDESQPKKHIPDWARSANLKEVLKHQSLHPPSYTKIFGSIKQPNLCHIFEAEKKRFKQRTSSAVWRTPDLSVSLRDRSTINV